MGNRIIFLANSTGAIRYPLAKKNRAGPTEGFQFI